MKLMRLPSTGMLLVFMVALSLSTAADRTFARTTPGDVDGNGTVNVNDVKLVSKYASDRNMLLRYPENADADHDGQITAKDAEIIYDKILGRSRTVVGNVQFGLPGKTYVGSLIQALLTIWMSGIPLEFRTGLPDRRRS